ncbi:hypothetical protein [Synechocystis sp. PCC 7509]|uniref:hypothetical protein n=1 Tax=Synechocystis sp. PCC 7509 TaxID=927677 RepID=UPI0002AC8AF4|nr:hypothetical protein [Synechocystis sp. PCC 7509]
MRYSITSRFRGTLLGVTLGEKITQPRQYPQIAKVIIPGAQSLVELGRFEREYWLEKLPISKLTPLQAIIATLPLALFYHDNKIKLRQNLLLVGSIWENDLIIQESILALGYAIAQALTEEFTPYKLIPQIVTFIDAPSTDLIDKLIQVQTLLEQKAGVERTITQLNQNKSCLTTSIALAFYYFLSTAEDLKLSVKRSMLSPFTSSAIVGALSGAYNSALSIPSSWQTIFVDTQTSAQTEMLQLSDYLVAVWSGMYNSEAKLTSTAVAAPRVIRSR